MTDPDQARRTRDAAELLLPAAIRAKVLELLRLRPGRRVLEIGAGALRPGQDGTAWTGRDGLDGCDMHKVTTRVAPAPPAT